jgi:hypothetical protein
VAATDLAAQSQAGLWQLGDHWSLILDVFERELAGQPEVWDRILIALVNAQPPATAETTAGA